MKKNLISDYLKFIIFFIFLENGHIAYIFFSLIFLILFFTFSRRKKILFSYKPYLFIFLIFLISLEKIYFYYDIYSYFNSQVFIDKEFYNFKHGFKEFINSLFPFIGNYYKSINRLPSNPYLIIFSIYLIIINFKKKEEINLGYIFLLLIIFTYTSILSIFNFILTGTWWIRDFTLIISSLICLKYLNQFNRFFRVTFIFIILAYSGLYFVKNVVGISKNQNNFLVDKPQDYSLINFFDELNISDGLNRIYFSPETYKFLNQNNASKFGIYDEKDLIKFNFIPFNTTFKNNKTTIHFSQKRQQKYYTQISPRYEYITDIFYLSLFNIQYSFVTDEELYKFNDDNFAIFKSNRIIR